MLKSRPIISLTHRALRHPSLLLTRSVYSTIDNNDDSKNSIKVPDVSKETPILSNDPSTIPNYQHFNHHQVQTPPNPQATPLVENAQYLKVQEERERAKLLQIPTPKALKKSLDDYIIGQNTTKKIISVALYKHQFIQQLAEIERKFQPQTVEPELEKSNILLVGPSGSGKTLIAKTLARLLKLPISITDCTSLTQAGFVGEDCESCIEKLLISANYDVDLCERGIVVLDEIDKLAKPAVYSGTKDIAGEGVQQGLLKLIEGTKVTVKVKNYLNVPGAAGDDQRGANAGDQNFIIDTSNILFISMGLFIGLDKIVSQRFSVASNIGFDAGESVEDQQDPDSVETLTSVQNESESLHFQEKITRLPDEELKTSEIAQVKLANGTKVSALQLVSPVDLQQFGLIPELVGRMPILTALDPLSIHNLVQISTEPKNSIVKQYEYFFKKIGVRLLITKDAIEKIAKISILNGTGARGLRSILEKILLTVNYDCPGSGVSFVLVDLQVIDRFLESDGLVNGETTDAQDSAKYYSRGEIFKFLNELNKEDIELASQIEQEYNLPRTTNVSKEKATG